MNFALKLIITFCAGMALGIGLYAFAPEFLMTANTEPPPNLISTSKRIDTSGQPTEQQLAGMKQAGYDLVINLAPPDALGSIKNEGSLVAASGITYVNIPVEWNNPQMSDFDLFSEILDHSGQRHILVHCQVNRRASLFTFLYRVSHENADVDQAYEDVTLIWSPEPHWLEFANNIMSRHQIEFDPL
jgi:protein tyrosine phosphatase (PTP) superfamily phosphohydrolase (DUF442 family)